MPQSPCPTCGLLSEHPFPSGILPSPRFSELLSVNTPPLDAEAVTLRHMVLKSSADLESLQSQIIKAQETLFALETMEEAALRTAADAKRILHPIRSLPQDILVEIFLCCTPIVNHHEVDWSSRGHKFDSLWPLNHPWNISHVSHRWREIALSLPRLWSVIYLDFRRYRFSPRQFTFLGSLFLERSAKLDLCVNIASGEKYMGDHPLVPPLKESTARWRILNAHMSSPSLQSFSGCEFPLLQELGVRDQDSAAMERDPPVDTFNNVQNVRTVNLYESFTDFESWDAIGQFPWSKLSKLTCHCTILEADFLSVLEQSSGVEDLTVKFHHLFRPLRNLPPHSTTLPALRRLEVIHDDTPCSEIEDFVRLLQLPSLHDLTLTFAAEYCLSFTTLVLHPDFHRVSSLCITRSRAQTSSISKYMGDYKALLQLLRIMVGVEGFQLKDKNVISEFLDDLVVGAEKGAVVLPSLKTLDLRECGFVNHYRALDSIQHIAESRSPANIKSHNHPCAPLERLVLPEGDSGWLEVVRVHGRSV